MTDFDAVVRAIATLEVSLGAIVKTQESIKGELKLLAPRYDTLTAEVREVARLVHRQGNMVQLLTNETSELAQAKVAFEDALKDIRTESAARALEFTRTQRAFDMALAVVEGRVRQMRDHVADALGVADSDSGDEASGVVDKTKM